MFSWGPNKMMNSPTLEGGTSPKTKNRKALRVERATRNLLAFDASDFLAAELESVPTFVRGVIHRTLRGDQGLNQRASAFGLGLSRPATHQKASGVNWFNATFGCATTDFTEGRVFQENPRMGAVMSVQVGAPKTYVGLLALYNKEMAHLESIEDGPHPDTIPLRKYLHWFMVQTVTRANK
jgi:hypothetical protein